MSSEERRNNIDNIVQSVNAELKDFQRATVDRVSTLFRNGQDRVLVADEVGMGKTMIAKGVIANMAQIRLDEGDELMKVVYICSNQSIANQNISELDVFSTGYDDVANTRLSMQHLMVAKSEVEVRAKKQYVQLIPLTPETSFRQSSGCGNVNERLIMYFVLRQMPMFAEVKEQLEEMLIYGANSSWRYFVDRTDDSIFNYKKLVDKYENFSKCGSDESSIFGMLSEYSEHLVSVVEYLNNRSGLEPGSKMQKDKDKECIIALRHIFAEISVNMLNPDLVIMDEFQRFKFVIKSGDADTQVLTEKFLTPNDNSLSNRIRILLLSATPYKLYSTLEELGDTNNDEPYEEFMDVMKFLHSEKNNNDRFCEIWNDYSSSLKEINANNLSIIKVSKSKAECELFKIMCRTERNSVMENGDYTEDKREPLTISDNDIKAHIDANNLLKETDLGIKFPIDYIKSCPYALSFMQNYETKKKIYGFFKNHSKEIKKARSKTLWVNKDKVNRFEELGSDNARLELLKKELFKSQGLQMLLWIPPCRPYYSFEGVFKGKENLSKVLIFSSWEMVPRMIGSLISYQEEVLTVGEFIKIVSDKKKLTHTGYFVKKRYPYPLIVSKSLGKIGLIYPAKSLAQYYNPSKFMGSGIPELETVEKQLKDIIHNKISPFLDKYEDKNVGREDEKWYNIAPMLLDGKEYVSKWRELLNVLLNDKGSKTTKDNSDKDNDSDLLTNIDSFINIVKNETKLGKAPGDLVDVLVNMTMASPAVCMYRVCNDVYHSTDIAQCFVNYFNSPESISVIELAAKKSDDADYWKNVLTYCKNGNIQSMIDEYVHLLTKGQDIGHNEKLDKRAYSTFDTALNLQVARYKVESYKDFEDKILGVKPVDKLNNSNRANMRSHFAAAFAQSEGKNDGKSDRRDSLRKSFNSPFWPFVLASTSIGQEGLDFHLYCRKIMHWNLPSNPVDLEQREGRINRFKCLAVRQNVAAKYGFNIDCDSIQEKDIWNLMFEAACKERLDGQSELIPYWCFGEGQTVKIERILAQFPLSKDNQIYERLIKVLSLYRLSMGQVRQEEFLEHVFNEFEDNRELKQLFIDLSPFSHKE